MLFKVAVATLIAASAASPPCTSFSSCNDCTEHSTWLPGSECRWCPDKSGSCHAEGSILNPCTPFSHSKNVFKPAECPAPTPSPSPPPPAPQPTSFAADLLTSLLAAHNITGVKPAECVKDIGRADVRFKDFAADIKTKHYEPAAGQDLGRALTALSTAAVPCGLSGLTAELAVLAAAARYANFSSSAWVDAIALADAIEKGDATAAGTALNLLLAAFRAVSKGCSGGSKGCLFLDHLLELMGMAAKDVAPCEAALAPAFTTLSAAASALASKNYSGAVKLFANGLDTIALAVSADSCNLKPLADEIGKLSPKLRAAVIKIEGSEGVKIFVGSAEVYDELYHAALDVQSGNMADLGVRLGMLLAQLRASGCTSPVCIIIEGLLQSLKLEAGDYAKCSKQLDAAWPLFTTAVADLEAHHWQLAAKATGAALDDLATSFAACGLDPLAKILEATADRLNATGVEKEIGAIVQVLSDGADLTLDLAQLLSDGKAGAWSNFGHDLGNLASWIQSTGCNSFVCRLLEGILNGAAIPFQSLQACAADLRSAEADFTSGAKAIASKQYTAALTYWGNGLHEVATSVGDCHIADELKYIAQEAQVLGFGKVMILNDIAKVLIHGSDFYDELFAAFQAISAHDYRTAGAEFGKAMNELSTWTKGHACTSDFCYVVLGMFEYLGDVQGDIRACESDFKLAFNNFSAAVTAMRDPKGKSGGDFPFLRDSAALKTGIKDIGYGLMDVSKGVSNCHLTQLAAIIEKLAVKLGFVPEVAWVEEALKILIEGVEIEQEVGQACVDYGDSNWVGFGYNIVKLIKTLVGDDLIEIPAVVVA